MSVYMLQLCSRVIIRRLSLTARNMLVRTIIHKDTSVSNMCS
jgi:hypothetical protein